MTVRNVGGQWIDFGDVADPDIDKIVNSDKFKADLAASAAAPSSSALPTTRMGWLGREAGIVGAHALAPLGALPAEIFGSHGVLPTREDIQGLAATPSGPMENTLAAGGTALGYALPTLALGAGEGAALAVPRLYGAAANAANAMTYLRPALAGAAAGAGAAAPVVAGAGIGGAAGEARRQYFNNLSPDVGAVVDLGLGAATGGLAGAATGAGTGAASAASRGAVGAGIGTAIGEMTEAVARHLLGLPPWIAQAISVPVGILAGAGTGAMRGLANPGAAAGAIGAELTPTPTNP